MELNNKAVGRNLAKFRMMRDMKASDLAERIGMKESAYTKYERGESKVTIDLVQKVATALKVDPISILAAAPDNFFESITNSPMAGIGNTVSGDLNTVDPKQQELMMKLMEKLIEMLGKR
jgi:transcriptional regulator with XRE-family HTH domain